MKILSIRQPGYLPFIGFFKKIQATNVFVFLDDVQYTRSDFDNRNKIRIQDDSMWLTIPIFNKTGQTLNEVKIDYSKKWVSKHKSSIEYNYEKAPYFEEYWKGKFDNRQGYAGWKAAPLERAHIIPHSLSGSNDDPSNFVMLCEKCHPLNPHTKSRAVYMKWLHSVKPNRESLLRKLTEDWFPDEEDLEIASAVWSNPTEVDYFYDWRVKNTSYHASFGKEHFSWDEIVQKMFPDLVAYVEWVKENGNYDNSNLSNKT